MRKNYTTTEELVNLLNGTTGLRGIKNRMINEATYYYVDKIKKRLGIAMDFQPFQCSNVISWIEKYDKNFKKHIANPYICKTKFNKETYIIDSRFIVKLDHGTYVLVDGSYEEPRSGDGDPRQKLSMYIFGKKCLQYFKDLTKYIDKKKSESKMLFSVSASSDPNSKYWSCVGTNLVSRTMDSLFFNEGVKQQIIEHIDNWVSNEETYTDRGLIFKTGILLYGKAGTGKSSLANAIANYLDCNMITVDTTTFNNLNLSEFVDAIVSDNTRYVVLIDEIDTIFVSRDKEDLSDKEKENTAKLLSLLDSPQSPTNVLFVGTTNYFEKLDKAVLRKGRFDLAVELADIDRPTAKKMCLSFNMDEKNADDLLDTCTFPVNPSDLQAMILDKITK